MGATLRTYSKARVEQAWWVRHIATDSIVERLTASEALALACGAAMPEMAVAA